MSEFDLWRTSFIKRKIRARLATRSSGGRAPRGGPPLFVLAASAGYPGRPLPDSGGCVQVGDFGTVGDTVHGANFTPNFSCSFPHHSFSPHNTAPGGYHCAFRSAFYPIE